MSLGCSVNINPEPIKCPDYLSTAFTGIQIKTSWIIPEDMGIVWEGSKHIVMHPYSLCSFLAYNGLYYDALDRLQKFLHEMIDHKFQGA